MVQALGVRQLAPRPGKSIFSDSFPFQQQHANCLSHIHHSQMCIRETDETMKKLMSTVYSQLQSKLSQMGISTRADPFNVLMVHVIRPGQTTPRHADTNYTIEGRFDVGSNSQQKDSIVAIFAFADSRTLKFSLVYKKTTRKKVKGKMTVQTEPVPLGHEFHFTLAHGTLFILSPHDEKPMHRIGFGPQIAKRLSYWTHESKGISKNANISFGITLRTCVHTMEVHKLTGLMKLSKKQELERQKPTRIHRDQLDLLHEWCYGDVSHHERLKDRCRLNNWCHADVDNLKHQDDKDLKHRFLKASRQYHLPHTTS